MSAIQTAGAVTRRRAQKMLVVLPCRAADVLALARDRRWLTGATIRPLAPGIPLIDRLLTELGEPALDAGRAALRLWGQTGTRPDGWVAAADPVWMQAGLEHVFLHIPPIHDIDTTALHAMLVDLQDALLVNREMRFETREECGYLRGAVPLSVAAMPATAIDRNDPARFMPDFNDPASADYYALCSEIEMSLFAHPYNRKREEQGQRPLNALWLWGGGQVTGSEPRALPTIYSDDPLLHGFGAYRVTECRQWPGSLSACVDRSRSEFIAVPPALPAETLQDILAELRSLWRARRVPSVTLLFDDVAIDQQKSWRRFFRLGARVDLRKVFEQAD